MSKIKLLKNTYDIVISKIINDWKKDNYQVVVKDHTMPFAECTKDKILDSIEFTEEAWADLQEYFNSNKSGIIWRPFTEQEQEEAWKPRFSGMNPDLIEYTRWGWDAAFEYVNDQILKRKLQEETR